VVIYMVAGVGRTTEERAALHAALGDPVRLAIVEDLATSDRAPSALAARFGQGSNLMTHHLDVLEGVGLIERHVSAGDRRRRYVRLRHEALRELTLPPARRPAGRALFVCTHNSARSPLAAALWRARTGAAATSAGTHPADRVHPGAVAAARRAGLDLADARPRALVADDLDVDVVVTVCDRAHEELASSDEWLHWSIPDPVDAGDRRAFDRALSELDERVTAIAESPDAAEGTTT
jgi:protein-tyrosine-phosphatase